MRFWNKKHVKEDDGEDDGEKMTPLPVHPVVRGFNLSIHEYVDCHIANLDEYQYDQTVIDKLVLPKDHKDLVDALTGGAISRMSDIIKGKAQGIIVLASGKPGTGKTLTAEVYSETIKRPLYMVQCSQLGTDEKELEKLLTEVLERATRWRAILLIDESDVYIHERGADIQQNAIVGVFLRLLEYFNGILFLTTNRETIIDDAIISRVTAHVRYNVPDNDEDKKRLWTILCTQYGIKVTTALLNCALKEFPKISGRSIRQLIRLGKFMADKEGREVEFADIKRAAKFHDFTELDDAK
jgi:SpoVK/Ycf46/Vps4 family AAA+-type ATPase